MNGLPPIKDSILSVIQKCLESSKARKSLSADFSDAINAVGERFVDLLLQQERSGRWWLACNGQWHKCRIKSVGKRIPRNFLPGTPEDWDWFPKSEVVRHLADRMTGPDHVVTVAVDSLNISEHVVLEQKLRFGSRQNLFADASTYVKHLRDGVKNKHGNKVSLPNDISSVDESFFSMFLEATKAVLLKRNRHDKLTHSGKVPHVCFVSMLTRPHKVFVSDANYTSVVECGHVGFVAPSLNHRSLEGESIAKRITERANVRLWLGLDSLLQQCTAEEVESAWTTAVSELSSNVRSPRWL